MSSIPIYTLGYDLNNNTQNKNGKIVLFPPSVQNILMQPSE